MDDLIMSVFYEIDNFEWQQSCILRSRTALKGCHFVKNLFLIWNNNGYRLMISLFH